jgi:hypothetical protein
MLDWLIKMLNLDLLEFLYGHPIELTIINFMKTKMKILFSQQKEPGWMAQMC